MASKKEYVVRHSMIGVINPETGDPYREGETVSADVLGDDKNQKRMVDLGAIATRREAEAEDKREETPGTPTEAEQLALEQSKIVDLDPSAAPEADHQELTPQAQGQPEQPAPAKKGR